MEKEELWGFGLPKVTPPLAQPSLSDPLQSSASALPTQCPAEMVQPASSKGLGGWLLLFFPHQRLGEHFMQHPK